MPTNHPFQLTEDERKALLALYSGSFPNPTLKQAARNTDWGPIGGGGSSPESQDAYYAPHERRCKRALDKLIAKGLCFEVDGHYNPTPLTEAWRDYDLRGRRLQHLQQEVVKVMERLDDLKGFLGYIERSVGRASAD